MEPVEGKRPKRGLQAAKEPLSLRFLLAFSASTVLTAAVAVPMAFQAHMANEDRPRAVIERPDVAVLGTSTVPEGTENSSEGLVYAVEPEGGRASLEGAELSGNFHLFLELPDVARVDFVLDDEPVVTDHSHPWRPTPGPEDETDPIAEGPHVLTATVTFDDGHVEVRRAAFTVVAG